MYRVKETFEYLVDDCNDFCSVHDALEMDTSMPCPCWEGSKVPVNEKGEEVLPVEYDEIWNFVGKNRQSTKVEKNGQTSEVFFCDLNPSLRDGRNNNTRKSYSYYEPRHYEEYAGSYAQDVMGYSDEDINDAFEGDPDAYWNID